MSDLGIDVSCAPDLDPLLEARSDNRIVAEALARRLQTPRGGLFYAPSYGYDLRAMMLARLDRNALPRIRAAIISECRKDDRVEDVDVKLDHDSERERLVVQIAFSTAAGPYSFTLSVTSLTLDLLG